MKRVVVIGAGPAGSAAAMGLARFPNLEVLLLERATIPRRKVCGSGLSPWTFDLLDEMGVGALIRKEAYPIHAAIMHSSRGRAVELRSHYELGVLLRARFDELLAVEAARRGAKLIDGVRVREIVRENGRVIGVRTDQGLFDADAAIVSSGAKTKLTTTARPGKILNTIMGWYENVLGTTDAVEIYYDPIIKPHYGWVFPEGPNRVNIGICYDSASKGPMARERFEIFLDRCLGKRLEKAQQIDKLVGHPIATTYRPTMLAEPGVLVVGEAGKLVDESSAEGIYYALKSGMIAGEFMGDTLGEYEDLSISRLAPYTEIVEREVGRRLRGGQTFLRLLKTPVVDIALAFGSLRPVKSLLTRVLASA